MSALTNRYEDDVRSILKAQPNKLALLANVAHAWAQDASHIPPGMKRVGYDADTERYTFREGDILWLGQPGSFYGGQMQWAGKVSQAGGEDKEKDDTDGSSTEHTSGSDHSNAPVKSLHEHAREATREANGSQRNVADNPWGVPVASISATGARPPDSPSPKDEKSVRTHATRKLRRAATLTANALGINNRRSRKDTNTA